jgi:hypothetical protein
LRTLDAGSGKRWTADMLPPGDSRRDQGPEQRGESASLSHATLLRLGAMSNVGRSVKGPVEATVLAG